MLEGLDRRAALAAAHRRIGVHQPLHHLGGPAKLRVVTAGDEIRIDAARMRRAVARAHDDQTLLLGLFVVARLDRDIGVGDRACELAGAGGRASRAGQIQMHPRQQREQRRGFDGPRHPIDHGLGE